MIPSNSTAVPPDAPALNRFLRTFLHLVIAQGVVLALLIGACVVLLQVSTPDTARITHLEQTIATLHRANATTLAQLRSSGATNHSETLDRLMALQAGEARIEAQIRALQQQKGG